MTPETNKEALAKLAKFTPKIGYPNKWRDYSTLKVKADDLVGNVERAHRRGIRVSDRQARPPVDRDEWLMTPQTVNAYYNPVKNEIVFPAAILQPPFFDVDGRRRGELRRDRRGDRPRDRSRLRRPGPPLRRRRQAARLVEAGRRRRSSRSGPKLLVEQFNAFKPLPDISVNGELTLGENIGDLGGLSIAHKAWKISLNGQASPVIDGLTGEQRFFMGWAQAWRAKARDEYLRRQVLADPHAWAEFRANGPLGNIPEFYEAFGVKPGDKLYREPDKRVKIW